MRKTDRAKALEIPQSVKFAVAQRDSFDGHPCCLLCGKPAPGAQWSCCHVIPRSQGGLGIEQNIVTLCPDCHSKLDQSPERRELLIELKNYLKHKYPKWSERLCTYDRRATC